MLGNRPAESQALAFLAERLERQGDHAGALEMTLESAAIAREVGWRWFEAGQLHGAATLERESGNLDAAERSRSSVARAPPRAWRSSGHRLRRCRARNHRRREGRTGASRASLGSGGDTGARGTRGTMGRERREIRSARSSRRRACLPGGSCGGAPALDSAGRRTRVDLEVLDQADTDAHGRDGSAFVHTRLVRSDLPAGTVTFLFTDIEGSTRLFGSSGLIPTPPRSPSIGGSCVPCSPHTMVRRSIRRVTRSSSPFRRLGAVASAARGAGGARVRPDHGADGPAHGSTARHGRRVCRDRRPSGGTSRGSRARRPDHHLLHDGRSRGGSAAARSRSPSAEGLRRSRRTCSRSARPSFRRCGRRAPSISRLPRPGSSGASRSCSKLRRSGSITSRGCLRSSAPAVRERPASRSSSPDSLPRTPTEARSSCRSPPSANPTLSCPLIAERLGASGDTARRDRNARRRQTNPPRPRQSRAAPPPGRPAARRSAGRGSCASSDRDESRAAQDRRRVRVRPRADGRARCRLALPRTSPGSPLRHRRLTRRARADSPPRRPAACNRARRRPREAPRPRQLLERIAQRLDLLKGGRDVDERHATLRATIAWSYDLLTEEEQQLFARLAVFRGGCTLDAAEAVCEADLDTLASLLDKSLVRRRTDADGEERFWMLETIREFARERLAASGEEDALRRAQADRLIELADRAGTRAIVDAPVRGTSISLHRRSTTCVRFSSGRSSMIRSAVFDSRPGSRHSGSFATRSREHRGSNASLRGAGRRRRISAAARCARSAARSTSSASTSVQPLLSGEPRALHARREDEVEAAHMRFRIAANMVIRGETAAAWPLLEEVLRESRELGNRLGESQALGFLAERAGRDRATSRALGDGPRERRDRP